MVVANAISWWCLQIAFWLGALVVYLRCGVDSDRRFSSGGGGENSFNFASVAFLWSRLACVSVIHPIKKGGCRCRCISLKIQPHQNIDLRSKIRIDEISLTRFTRSRCALKENNWSVLMLTLKGSLRSWAQVFLDEEEREGLYSYKVRIIR